MCEIPCWLTKALYFLSPHKSPMSTYYYFHWNYVQSRAQTVYETCGSLFSSEVAEPDSHNRVIYSQSRTLRTSQLGSVRPRPQSLNSPTWRQVVGSLTRPPPPTPPPPPQASPWRFVLCICLALWFLTSGVPQDCGLQFTHLPPDGRDALLTKTKQALKWLFTSGQWLTYPCSQCRRLFV